MNDLNVNEARQQSALVSNGVYSVLHDKWIKKPVKTDIPEVDHEAFEKLFKEWEDRYFNIVEGEDIEEDITSEQEKKITEIEDFIEDVYDMRKTSIATEGEYGTANLVFKELRDLGYLDNLRDLKCELISKKLSLESVNESFSARQKKIDKLLKEDYNKDMHSIKDLKHLREDDKTNAAMELMIHNFQYDEEAYVGCFWYDIQKKELFGIDKAMHLDLPYYYSKMFNTDIRTTRRTHRMIWKKEQYKGKDKRFSGRYEQCPRGRVFEFKDEGFRVYVGNWIDDCPQAKEQILFEFDLPKDKTTFIKDTHWNLGHGWSEEF